MGDFPEVKTEYNYLAVVLVFGNRSPKVKQVSAFTLDVLRKEKDLIFREESGLNISSRPEITRHVRLDEKRSILTSHTDMRSEINRIVTYIDKEHQIKMSDSIFSDEEFEYFKQDWNEQVESKVRNFGFLLQALHKKDMSQLPILVNEFPEITKTVLEHPDFWQNKGNDDGTPASEPSGDI